MTTFRVWAPLAKTVTLVVGDRHDHPEEGDEQADSADHVEHVDREVEMTAAGGGWWSVEFPGAGHGTDYAFRPDGEAELPDPRSAWQPYGVHGRSRRHDHGRTVWTDAGWRGVPLAGSVLYELHVGTFTPDGTFDAAIERLDHLVGLGIDAVELLPVNAFPGRHGWGYDSVGLFAVHETYGGPEGLARFVDAAHARGIGVIMDVVYNHLGPDGNYLAQFGPYFTNCRSTPWGPAINLDAEGSDEVRAFVIDNVLSWLRDFHCDGLRLDAVHAFDDSRAVHILEEISTAVRGLAASQRRPLFVVAESNLNDPKLVKPVEAGGYGLDGQWCDDVHHALWSALSGERRGYYVDFGSLATLAHALEHAFVHDGSYSTFRGRRHGRPVPATVPTHRFVAFLQNHDQIGNRATGDRSSATLSEGMLRVGAALLLTAPFTPMLFMGEEWGAVTAWQYFTDHEAARLGEAARTGRRAEFAAHGWPADQIPDPQDVATFTRSKLDWTQLDMPQHADLLDWYRRLIRLRRGVPEFTDPSWSSVRCAYDEQARYFVVYRGCVAVVCNLARHRQAVPVERPPVDVLTASAPGFTFAPTYVELDAESVVIARLVPTLSLP